jgi:hypothetical protein
VKLKKRRLQLINSSGKIESPNSSIKKNTLQKQGVFFDGMHIISFLQAKK